MRRVLASAQSLPALVASTVILAAGVSFVELACTAGFPVLWTNIVAGRDVSPVAFGALLGLYMLIYQLDELVIFGGGRHHACHQTSGETRSNAQAAQRHADAQPRDRDDHRAIAAERCRDLDTRLRRSRGCDRVDPVARPGDQIAAASNPSSERPATKLRVWITFCEVSGAAVVSGKRSARAM